MIQNRCAPGNWGIFEIVSTSLQDTKIEKEISYKTKVNVVNITEPCVYNMNYGIIELHNIEWKRGFGMFN